MNDFIVEQVQLRRHTPESSRVEDPPPAHLPYGGSGYMPVHASFDQYL